MPTKIKKLNKNCDGACTGNDEQVRFFPLNRIGSGIVLCKECYAEEIKGMNKRDVMGHSSVILPEWNELPVVVE